MHVARLFLAVAALLAAAGSSPCCDSDVLPKSEAAATPGACVADAPPRAAVANNTHGVTLFLRIYTGAEAETANQLLPSLALFWPGARVLAVLDGESATDHKYGPRLAKSCLAAGVLCNVTYTADSEVLAATKTNPPTTLAGHGESASRAVLCPPLTPLQIASSGL